MHAAEAGLDRASSAAAFAGPELTALASRVREPVEIVAHRVNGMRGLAPAGADAGAGVDVIGSLPPLYPEWLGDRSFGEAHGARFPYVAGEMARGISGTRMVIAMAGAGALGFYGAAGVDMGELDRALIELSRALAGLRNWGVNLIHSPDDPAREDAVVDLLMRHEVPCVSMSAFTRLTPAVVRCAASGLHADAKGRIVRPVSVVAKLSRPEVAEQFMAPAPAELLRTLRERGQLSDEECRLAARVAVAEDITVEADSGGHTDRRPMGVVLPAVLAARDALAEHLPAPAHPVRVGVAGCLGDPPSVAAAFALGAAYVLTGTVNQMAVEAATSDAAKAMLGRAGLADTAMAPSSDMFERGAEVQVLRRGTRFPAKAARLGRAYRAYPSLEAVPDEERTMLEQEMGQSLPDMWELTCAYWTRRDPTQLDRAAADPKHRMALVFRWYLAQTSRWAIEGHPGRVSDYQLWCSPAAGAFNRWIAGTFLADPAQRTVAQIALNLLEGAAVHTRAHQLRTFGLALPAAAFAFAPRPLR